MHLKGLSCLAFVSSIASALPSAAPAGHEYIPPGPGDVRSPCPGINALANHGFINRNGKDITVPQLVAGGRGLGIGPDFMLAVGGLALFSPAKPNFVTFDMDDLDEHNFPIEHDVSLTRQDFFFTGETQKFYEPYYREFISYFDGMESTDTNSSAAARLNRVNFSRKNNPDVIFGPMAFAFSYGETGLYTQTMGSSPLATSAPVEYVKSLFEHERLPYHLGWQPSVLPITLATLGAYNVQLFAAQKDKLPTGLEVFTRGTYRQLIFNLKVALEKAHNVTTPRSA